MLNEEYLGHWLGITQNALMRKTTAHLHDLNLTIKQFGVLNTLYQEDRLTSSELAHRLSSDSSTIMAIVDQLEKKGFLRRESSSQDRRIKHLVLTDKAREIETALIKRVNEFDRAMREGISKNEIQRLKASLQKILKFALDP